MEAAGIEPAERSPRKPAPDARAVACSRTQGREIGTASVQGRLLLG